MHVAETLSKGKKKKRKKKTVPDIYFAHYWDVKQPGTRL